MVAVWSRNKCAIELFSLWFCVLVSFHLNCGKERSTPPSGTATSAATAAPAPKAVIFKVRGVVVNRKGAPVPEFGLSAYGYDTQSKKSFVTVKEGKVTNPFARTDTSGAPSRWRSTRHSSVTRSSSSKADRCKMHH